jgi:hypothetical protein
MSMFSPHEEHVNEPKELSILLELAIVQNVAGGVDLFAGW